MHFLVCAESRLPKRSAHGILCLYIMGAIKLPDIKVSDSKFEILHVKERLMSMKFNVEITCEIKCPLIP